jgi:hypothetical protein
MSDPGTVIIIAVLVVCVHSYAMAKLVVTGKAAFFERREEIDLPADPEAK